MYKTIPLTHGLSTIVDADDFERCAQFKWYVSYYGYVVRNIRKSDGSKSIQRLSRFIMNAPRGVHVDHIHGNKLDNRKAELRLCTNQQNCFNRGINKNNKSGFKGVSWHKQASKWVANIVVSRKQICLGFFDDINDAAAAYAAGSLKHHGEFGRLSW